MSQTAVLPGAGTASPKASRGGADSPSDSSSPDDRSTSFQPVTGPQAEHYSGEVLLISAYALVWIILFAWVATVWRKQSAMGRRLDDLERVLDTASARRDAKATAAPRPEGRAGASSIRGGAAPQSER